MRKYLEEIVPAFVKRTSSNMSSNYNRVRIEGNELYHWSTCIARFEDGLLHVDGNYYSKTTSHITNSIMAEALKQGVKFIKYPFEKRYY